MGVSKLNANRDQVIKRHREGASDRQIALELGIEDRTVSRWRGVLGLGRNFEPPGSKHGKSFSAGVSKARKPITYSVFEMAGRYYSEEQREFVMAMGKLKERLGRMPTLPEVLQRARELGYQRGCDA